MGAEVIRCLRVQKAALASEVQAKGIMVLVRLVRNWAAHGAVVSNKAVIEVSKNR